MGSRVRFRCEKCAFGTDELAVGWGKAGRDSYWGGLAHCPECRALTVVNLAEARANKRDHRCPTCKGLLKLIDGTSERVPCPKCGGGLDQVVLGSWA